MYINATGYYVPAERVDNEYFKDVNGLTSDWIYKRTGIKSRSKAGEGEGHNSMGLNAIEDALKTLPYDIKDVDLIVSASYSPYDTVATLAHIAQRKYDITGAKAVYVSAACSSFVNGLEIIETYLLQEKRRKRFLFALSTTHITPTSMTPNAGTSGVTQLWLSSCQSTKLLIPMQRLRKSTPVVLEMLAKVRKE